MVIGGYRFSSISTHFSKLTENSSQSLDFLCFFPMILVDNRCSNFEMHNFSDFSADMEIELQKHGDFVYLLASLLTNFMDFSAQIESEMQKHSDSVYLLASPLTKFMDFSVHIESEMQKHSDFAYLLVSPLMKLKDFSAHLESELQKHGDFVYVLASPLTQFIDFSVQTKSKLQKCGDNESLLASLLTKLRNFSVHMESSLQNHCDFVYLLATSPTSPMDFDLHGTESSEHDQNNDESDSSSEGRQWTLSSLLSSPAEQEEVVIDVDPNKKLGRKQIIPVFRKKLEQDGKERVDEIDLDGVRGYTTFAKKVANAAGQRGSVISHVVWPWQSFGAKYLKEGDPEEELNPLLMPWGEFITKIDYVLMEQNLQEGVRKVPVTFKRKDNTVLIESYLLLTDSVKGERKCFWQAVHFLWAAWHGEEPQTGEEEIVPGSDIVFNNAEGESIDLPGDGNEAEDWIAFIEKLASVVAVEEVFNPWADDDDDIDYNSV